MVHQNKKNSIKVSTFNLKQREKKNHPHQVFTGELRYQTREKKIFSHYTLFTDTQTQKKIWQQLIENYFTLTHKTNMETAQPVNVIIWVPRVKRIWNIYPLVATYELLKCYNLWILFECMLFLTQTR